MTCWARVEENVLVRRGRAPLLLSCEHAGRDVPPDLLHLRLPAALLETHWGWDRHAWWTTLQVAQALGASAVGSRVSRLVLDVNRDPGHPDLIRAEAGGEALEGNRSLGPAQVEARLTRLHAPYHLALGAELRRLVEQGGGPPLLIAMHSFTGRWPGQERGFDVGVLFDRHEDLAGRVAAALGAEGLSVRLNEPYSGLRGEIYSATRHGGAQGVAYLELELNQDRLEPPAGRARLAAAVTRALASLEPGPAGDRAGVANPVG